VRADIAYSFPFFLAGPAFLLRIFSFFAPVSPLPWVLLFLGFAAAQWIERRAHDRRTLGIERMTQPRNRVLGQDQKVWFSKSTAAGHCLRPASRDRDSCWPARDCDSRHATSNADFSPFNLSSTERSAFVLCVSSDQASTTGQFLFRELRGKRRAQRAEEHLLRQRVTVIPRLGSMNVPP